MISFLAGVPSRAPSIPTILEDAALTEESAYAYATEIKMAPTDEESPFLDAPAPASDQQTEGQTQDVLSPRQFPTLL
jgi:hypothetical protein